MTLREACELMLGAESAESLGQLQELGGRALNTPETDRSALEPGAKDAIETAIRHARNAHLAVHAEGGRHDAREAQELIAGLLGG